MGGEGKGHWALDDAERYDSHKGSWVASYHIMPNPLLGLRAANIYDPWMGQNRTLIFGNYIFFIINHQISKKHT